MKNTLDQHKTHHPSLGFTLIEIMIVIAVISILAVVTIPKYQAFQNHYYLESAAQIVTNDLRLAKQLAMDRRETMTVELLVNSISVKSISVSRPTQVFDAQEYDRGITATPVSPVTFDYHGFVTSGSANVVLRKGGSQVTITIKAQTGTTILSWQ